MLNVESIKNIVNLSNVDNNVEMFIDQYNTLNNTSFDSLDAILDVMKSTALQQLMKPAATATTSRVTKYETDEQRRIARNEASKRCNDKKRAALAELKAAAAK